MPVRYTEHQKLSQIRTKRFMRCLVPMLLLFATVIFTILAPGHSYYLYPSLILIVMSISWFLYVSNTFRCKKGIVIPENNGLLSPIEGRIKTIRKTDDYILLTISKAAFDLAELRAPAHNSRVLYNDILECETPYGKAEFRFKANELIWLQKTEIIQGEIVGMLIGKATCSVHMPAGLLLSVVENQISHSGETLIIDFPKVTE